MIGEVWQTILNHERPSFAEALLRHIELSLVSVVAGILIAVPLALVVSRSRGASLAAINAGNLGRAVPDLALLALALPLIGLGFWPPVFALIAISIPPILINSVTGLREVEHRVVDAARGMGLSEFQIMTTVRLPVAAPVIFAGIRTSAVQVVAGATLATFIGGGGLGDFIVEGFQVNSIPTMLAGALPVAALAIITELSFGVLERISTPKGLRIGKKKKTRR